MNCGTLQLSDRVTAREKLTPTLQWAYFVHCPGTHPENDKQCVSLYWEAGFGGQIPLITQSLGTGCCGSM